MPGCGPGTDPGDWIHRERLVADFAEEWWERLAPVVQKIDLAAYETWRTGRRERGGREKSAPGALQPFATALRTVLVPPRLARHVGIDPEDVAKRLPIGKVMPAELRSALRVGLALELAVRTTEILDVLLSGDGPVDLEKAIAVAARRVQHLLD